MKHSSLEIDSIAYGGKGVARIDGKVFFVQDTVPGDVVDIIVTKDTKSFAEAEVENWVKRSQIRVPSPCQYSDECGGCQWQEVPYKTQITWKKSFVVDALKRIAKLEHIPKLTIHPSPDHLNYRNRILLRVHVERNKQPKIGFFKTASRDLIAIDKCKIARRLLNRFITDLSKLRLDVPDQKFRLEIQELPLTSQVAATFHPADPRIKGLDSFVEAVKGWDYTAWAGTYKDVKQSPHLNFDEHLDRRFLTQPGQFQQVNFYHNQTLRNLIATKVEECDVKTILDLFCGSGNLSLALANGQRYIEGIEFNKNAIAVARANVKANRLSNISYFSGDAAKHIAKLKTKFDMIIVDPPRQGMADSLALLGKVDPKYILYVSCDPNTFARDIGRLIPMGYKLMSLDCFDFFPATFHIESFAVLTK